MDTLPLNIMSLQQTGEGSSSRGAQCKAVAERYKAVARASTEALSPGCAGGDWQLCQRGAAAGVPVPGGKRCSFSLPGRAEAAAPHHLRQQERFSQQKAAGLSLVG